jgi:hypothetical protein
VGMGLLLWEGSVLPDPMIWLGCLGRFGFGGRMWALGMKVVGWRAVD